MQVKPAPASCCRRPRVDGTDDPTALERLRRIERIDTLRREDGFTLRQALKAVELPRSTYYDWRKALRERGVAGLVPKSRRPFRSPGPRWTKRDERRVLAVRDARPYCGKRRIHHELERRKGGCGISASTVGRILQRARKRGRIRPCAFLRGRVAPKRRRDFANGHARRWKHGERATAPGQLVQIDHMTVRLDGAELKEVPADSSSPRRLPLHQTHVRARLLPRLRLQRPPLLPRPPRLHARRLRAGRRRQRVHAPFMALRGSRASAGSATSTWPCCRPEDPSGTAAVEACLKQARQRHLPHRVLEPLPRRLHRRRRQRRVPALPPLLQRTTAPPRHRHGNPQRVLRYPLRAARNVRNVVSPDKCLPRQLLHNRLQPQCFLRGLGGPNSIIGVAAEAINPRRR